MDYLRAAQLTTNDPSSVYQAIDGTVKTIWGSLPAIISIDSDGHIATANSAVNLAVTQLDGSVVMTAFPPLDTSPVHYPNGGGVSHTHPVKKGDEGLVVFTSRAQDLWHQKGGVQDPIDSRTHHLADSRWLPGGRSDPRKLNPPPSTTSQQNRSDNGNHVMDVHPSNGITHSSTKKHLVIVGGGSGGGSAAGASGGGGGLSSILPALMSAGAQGGSGAAGTIHLPSGNILKNAAKVLINCIQQSPLPPPGSSFANKKLIALKPIGAMAGGGGAGGISSILSQVMSGGIGSLLSSPTAGATSGLISQITGAISQITGALGGGGAGVTSALGGLSGAVGALETGVSALSGATSPTGGAFGLADVLAHAQSLSEFFGTSGPAPGAVALTTVLAPLQSAPTLQAMTMQIALLADSVVAGTTSPSIAAATVGGLTGQVAPLMTNANAAIAALQAAAPALNLALLAGSAGVSLDPNELAVHGALTGPNLAALTAAMQSIFTLGDDEIASVQSFPDATADSAGATGGL